MDSEKIIRKCKLLLDAYKSGKMGNTQMPEDSNPGFTDSQQEMRLAYFTLPMALNYQRNSYSLWQAALATYNNEKTRIVFDASEVRSLSATELMQHLTKYRVAIQPNKQTHTWKTICETVATNFGSFSNLIATTGNDFTTLRQIVQDHHKKGFPYLCGPKIFNYWSFILKEYANVPLKNPELIEIAPDTHVIKCSITLGIITEKEAKSISKEKISEKWRNTLAGSGINPIDLHSPLWFWSRNGFAYKLEE